MDTRTKIELHNAGLISDEDFGKVVAEILGETDDGKNRDSEDKNSYHTGRCLDSIGLCACIPPRDKTKTTENDG